jgi:hypothetical protein
MAADLQQTPGATIAAACLPAGKHYPLDKELVKLGDYLDA